MRVSLAMGLVAVLVGSCAGPTPTKTSAADDAVSAFEEAVSEATQGLGETEQEAEAEAGTEPERPANAGPAIADAAASIVAAAKELVAASVGTPMESDAKSILGDSERLLEKVKAAGQGADAVADFLRETEQLRTRAGAIARR